MVEMVWRGETGCAAIQVSDQMICRLCDLNWDVNDPAPPECAYNLRSRSAVNEILENASKTFQSRNAEYGGGYKRVGEVLMALFPEGGVPPIRTAADAARLRFIIFCASKLQRYCNSFETGGHADSADDLIVYAAMLREFTK